MPIRVCVRVRPSIRQIVEQITLIIVWTHAAFRLLERVDLVQLGFDLPISDRLQLSYAKHLNVVIRCESFYNRTKNTLRHSLLL